MPRVGSGVGYKPYWIHPDGKAELWHGNCIEVLRRLPAKSVQCCITSPPYFALRSYETGENKHLEIGSEVRADCLGWATGQRCECCFVCHMVQVFDQVRRVLRDDGTCWLNLGDTWGGGGMNNNGQGASTLRSKHTTAINLADAGSQTKVIKDLADGNMLGVPWRTALALQADGWVLRQDIIWHSPNKMPESVESRCSKAHEYVFLLTKQGSGYYFDHEAIKEQSKTVGDNRAERTDNTQEFGRNGSDSRKKTGAPTGELSNKRSVWTISSEPYEGSHYAAFPTKLVEPCLLSGTSAYGCCAECGKPYERIVCKEQLLRDRPNEYVKRVPGAITAMHGKMDAPGGGVSTTASRGVATCANTVAGVRSTTVGWQKACNCQTSEVKPCVVLDTFVGSGTTPQVCIERGRYAIGIELSEKYINDNAIPRIMAAKLIQSDPLVKLEPVKVVAPPTKKISFSKKKVKYDN